MQFSREFTPPTMSDLDGGNSIDVKYEIKGDEVWVKPRDPCMAARCKVDGDPLHCHFHGWRRAVSARHAVTMQQAIGNVDPPITGRI
jgi:hypothetical protein